MKIYSLERNGQPIVTVEMDVPDFMPKTTINRAWLKGIVTEELAASQPKPARPVRSQRSVRSAKVSA